MTHTTRALALCLLAAALAPAVAHAAPETLGHATELLVAVDNAGASATAFATLNVVAGEPTALRVRVHNPATGQGTGAIPVKAMRGEDLLASGATGADGNASLSVTLADSCEITLIAAPPGREHRVVISAIVASPLRTWLTTDKPLYLPGQTAVIRALTVKMPSRAAAAGIGAAITVRNPFGVMVGRASGNADSYGIFAYEFAIAGAAAEGDYTIEAAIAGGETLTATVLVERYRLPKFVLSVTPDAAGYAPGENVAVRLNAAYTFGEPVAGGRYDFFARVQWQGGLREVHRRTGTFSEQGRGREAFRIPDDLVNFVRTGEASLFCQMDVLDNAGNRGTAFASAFIAIQPVACTVRVESGDVLRPGLRNWCLARFTTPDGAPVHAAVSVTVGRQQVSGETSPNGVFRFPIDVGTSQPGTLNAVITESTGAKREVSAAMPPLGDARPFAIAIDDPIAAPGAPVSVRVAWREEKDAAQPVVFEWLHHGRVIASVAAVPGDGRVTITAPSRDGIDGFVELRAYRCDLGITRPEGGAREEALVLESAWQTPVGAQSVSAALFIPSPRILKIDTEWLESYRPGDPGTLAIKVTRADGSAPGATALSVELIDLGVLTLRPRARVALSRFLMFEPALFAEPLTAETPASGVTADTRARAQGAVRWLGSLQLASRQGEVPFARSLRAERALSLKRVEELARKIREARPYVAFRRVYHEPVAWLKEFGEMPAEAFVDAWGHALVFDASEIAVRSFGPDGAERTLDDLTARVPE